MPEDQISPIELTPQSVLRGASPLVLTATLRPVAGLDRFQPAGFPEIGHVIYKAPRKDGRVENVCIVDSPASMANHLESVCMRGPHDFELDDDLAGMPHVRCVTGKLILEGKLAQNEREVVATSLTEAHRIASKLLLEGQAINGSEQLETKKVKKKEKNKGTGKEQEKEVDAPLLFEDVLIREFGVVLPNSTKAHPPAAKWWGVFETIFRYDPNALVHGVLFPQWQIKIARFLTAHLEAFGAARVDRSGVKFDNRLLEESVQPIFAVDDETASEIRATFILDVALLRSFGRTEKKDGSNGEDVRGLSEKQKEFIVAFALWKIDRLLKTPFRYRSGCHLELVSLKHGEREVKFDVKIKDAITGAAFRAGDCREPIITDIYWPHDELYREAEHNKTAETVIENNADEEGGDEDGDSEDA